MFTMKPPLGTPLNFEDPLNDGLVMHLAMNEGMGDVVRDLSMYGNHGTLHNFTYPPTVASGWNPGREGVTLNYDGGNNYIDCGNKASLDPDHGLTLSAWVRPTSITSVDGRRLVQKYAYTDPYTMYFTSTGTVYVRINTDAANYNFTSNSVIAVANEWVYLVEVYTGTKLQLFVNGHLNKEINASGTPLHPTGNLYIGTNSTTDSFFSGAIDQVRVLNRAYTAKEVMQRTVNPWQVYLDEDD